MAGSGAGQAESIFFTHSATTNQGILHQQETTLQIRFVGIGVYLRVFEVEAAH
jgi:hypothetical protein